MIRFENVTKVYKGNAVVIDNVSFTIPKGEIVVLIGSSGCGKTTCLKMMNKLIKPTSGVITIADQDIASVECTELRRKQGYVVQSTGLFPHLTVKENIEIIPTLQKKDPEQIAQTTRELMKMVGLNPKEFLHRYPTQLSGGQQQRVGVARAFATDPDLILMDEPFSALDPLTRTSLQEELLKIQEQYHKTIVFVTHDMDEAIKIADKICIMHQGEILQYDTPENILKNPINAYVEDFVGKNRMWTQPEYIRASDIWISEPMTAPPQMTILKAAEFMRSTRVDSLLVTDDDGKLLGIFSISKLHRGIKPTSTIEEIMTTDYITVSPNDNMLTILEKFNNGASTLPVVDRYQILRGLITRSCLVSTMSRQFFTEEA